MNALLCFVLFSSFDFFFYFLFSLCLYSSIYYLRPYSFYLLFNLTDFLFISFTYTLTHFNSSLQYFYLLTYFFDFLIHLAHHTYFQSTLLFILFYFILLYFTLFYYTRSSIFIAQLHLLLFLIFFSLIILFFTYTFF